MDRMGKYLTFLLVVMLIILTLIMVEPAKAQGERVATYCTISVDNIVEGQPVTATIQMSPATPTGEGYTQLIVYLKSPNGVGASSPNGPWVYTNISTDTNGKATITFDVPTYSGKWYVFVNFGSHYYTNYSMLYLAGTWQAEFTISPPNTPTPSATTTPTASPLPTTNPSPTIPELFWLPILPIFLSILSIAVLMKKRK